MDNDKIVERLGKLSMELNGIIGRLIVPAHSDIGIKETMRLGIELGNKLDDLINEIL